MDLVEIQAAIEKGKATWVAEANPILQLSEADQHARLGVILDEAQLGRLRREKEVDMVALIAGVADARHHRPAVDIAEATRQALALTASVRALPGGLPPTLLWPFRCALEVDWRFRHGRNFVTPITDQGGCGSCVSFGATATLESMVLIDHYISTDLSEAELLFCGGGSCGGWWPDPAVTYLKTKGLSQESCFPYHDFDMPCGTCLERDAEAIKVTGSAVIWNATQRRDYINFVGPVMCVFEVYGDFFGYSSGVYTHVTGGLAGLHCVEVIGFDDFQSCWICKNSWGSYWGDAGFFRIAYGQCGIDSTFPFWGIYGAEFYT